MWVRLPVSQNTVAGRIGFPCLPLALLLLELQHRAQRVRAFEIQRPAARGAPAACA